MKITRDHSSEQLEVPGTEDPARDAELDAQLHGWLDAKEQQTRAAADTKLRHSVLVAAMEAKGVQRYPYTDRSTGKRRFVVIARDPKARTIKPPSVRKPKDERKAEKAAEKKRADEAASVEHRKVSRADAEREIGPLDPFAAVRSAMEGTQA